LRTRLRMVESLPEVEDLPGAVESRAAVAKLTNPCHQRLLVVSLLNQALEEVAVDHLRLASLDMGRQSSVPSLLSHC
jgi:hypothetical protein